MPSALIVSILLVSASCGLPVCAENQKAVPAAPTRDERIVSRAEVEAAARPAAALPLRVVFYPFHIVNAGMESGLISFERNRMRERLDYWTSWMRSKGVAALLGGLGEGTGFGLGGSSGLP